MKHIYKRVAILCVALLTITAIFFTSCMSGQKLSPAAAAKKEEITNMKKIVGYYPDWGVYGGHRNYFVETIPYDKLTHVQVAFAKIEPDTYNVVSADPWADFDKVYNDGTDNSYRGNYRGLKKFKAKYPHISTLVSIGGWTLSSQFALLAKTKEDRLKFATSAIKFMRANDLDGLDIDWEYPTKNRAPDKVDNPNDEGTPYEDESGKKNFTLLMKTLRKQLDEAGAADERYYQLTAAVGASAAHIEGTEPDKYAKYLDFINLMSYDFHGAWDTRTNHHSPIFTNPNLPDDGLSIENAARILAEEYNVPKNKIVVGAPFYSRGWKEVDCSEDSIIKNKDGSDLPGLYCKANGGAKGRWDGGVAAGINAWYDIANEMIDKDGFVVYRDQYSKTPYLYNESKKEFYTYEDEISAKARVDFVNDNNYGGIIIWEITADTRTEVGDADKSLLNVIYDGFYGNK